MASAPAVQNLQDIVSQYSAADQPVANNINSEIAQNDASGATQVQGINAAKDTAFQGIDQKANDNGMYFSGFRPDQQAQYLGSTYLPALAKLQDTIATTRNTLLGQKAALQSDEQKNALTTQQDEQKALDAWNLQQDTDAKQAQLQQEAEQAKMQEDAANNAKAIEAAQISAGAATAKATVSPDAAALQILGASRGNDGYVSPSSFELARKAYVAAGGNAGDFAKNYWSFTGTNAGQPNQANWKAYYYG